MHLDHVTPSRRWGIAIHGGAGGRVDELAVQGPGPYADSLAQAHSAGEQVLEGGGSSLDAVCAAVVELEDNPLFNAGRGAALRSDGSVELDAAVMTGAGRAGGIAVTRHARNPVLAARKVMEDGGTVLRVRLPADDLVGWGLSVAEQDYFITPGRVDQLRHVQAGLVDPPKVGTVGAVARDQHGRLAAATSTGGSVNQVVGRVGDTPVIGAGTYARDDVVAISCTGFGEAFLQGVVAHDIAARVRYAGEDLSAAVAEVLRVEVGGRGATGGLIAVGPDGETVIAHISPAMYSAHRGEDCLVVRA